MNAESKAYNSIIQLDNGSNYEVVESVSFIEMLITDDFINADTFLKFHFTDGMECRIKKSRISVFYECEAE